MLANPVLMAALYGYPLTVSSAPCIGCGAQIDLPEPEVFDVKGSLSVSAQCTLQYRVASHDPACRAIAEEEVAEGAVGPLFPGLRAKTSVMIKYFGNLGTIQEGPDEYNTYLVSHDGGRSRISRGDLDVMLSATVRA